MIDSRSGRLLLFAPLMKAYLLALAVFIFGSPILGAPANDLFSAPQVIPPGNAIITGSNVGATYDAGQFDILDVQPKASVWFIWTAPSPGLVTISTASSSFDTLLGVYEGDSIFSITTVAENDDDSGAGLTSKVVFPAAVAGATYRICVAGYDGDSGTYRLSISINNIGLPSNDNVANATLLSGTNVVTTGNNYLATIESSEPKNPIGIDGEASVWWIWEAPTSERYLFTTLGSDFDTVLSIYQDGTLLAYNDEADGHTSATRLKTTAGVRYLIEVQGWLKARGAISLQIRPDPPAPAPPWVLTDMNGQLLSSTNCLGKVIILDFWATWCGPCVAEIPDFITMQTDYAAQGFEIIGVSSDVEGFGVVAPFVQNNGVNYRSTLSTLAIEQSFGPIQYIPTTYIIDRNGMIIDRFVGTHSRAQFDAVLLPLLAQSISVSLVGSREGNQLVLRWPASAAGYILQAADDMNPAKWADFTAEFTFIGSETVARIPLSPINRCFRLFHN
jgi:thiol-disulfide isomerase/thioredoxin